MSRTSSDGRRASRTARRRGAIVAVGVVAAFGLSACGDEPAQPGSAAVVGQDRVTVSDLQTAYTEINEVAQGPSGQALPQNTLLGWLMVEPLVVPEAARAGVAVSEDDARALLDQLKAQSEAQKAAQASPSPSPSPSESPAESPTESPGAETPEASASPTASPSPSVQPGDYSEPTIAAIRSYLSIQNVAQKLGDEQPIKQWWNQVLDQLEKENPQVSPRYGKYTRPDVDSATSFDELLNVIGTPTPNWFVGATESATKAPAEAPGEPSPTTTP